MKLSFGDKEVSIIINRKKIKNMYFRFDDDLNLIVSANKYQSDKQIYEVIKKNYNNIFKLYHKVSSNQANPDYFYYLGNKYLIIIDPEYKKVFMDEDSIYVKDLKALDSFCKKSCVELIGNRVEKNRLLFTDLPDFSVKYRQMKTRWGVCNYATNTVTFNTELLKKDVSLIDYVIIHELCHFHHHDHSKYFWEEVSKYYPYYKTARKQLGINN